MKFNIDRFKELKKDKEFENIDIKTHLKSKGILVSIDTIKNWTRKTNPKTPSVDVMRKLAEIFSVPLYELDNDLRQDMEKELKNLSTESVEMIDYVDLKAGAGAEGIFDETINHKPIPVTKQFLNGVDTSNLVALQVVGDSMQPTINPDEFVIVDKANGREFYLIDGIYLINKDGTIQIKRLHFKGDKGVDIISDNATYPKENTINDAINLEIIGKLFKQIKNLGALAVRD